MIKTKKCPKCAAYYDETLPECPTCHEKNDFSTVDVEKQKKHSPELPLGRQILAFASGWLGLDILATIISLVISLVLSWQYSDPAEVALAMQTLKISMYINFFAYVAAGTFIGLLYDLLGIAPSDNANESAVVAMMKGYPLMSFVAFVILGPVCEELTYRLGLFSGIRRYSKIAAYCVVIVLFGLIHFDFQTTDWTNELLNLPYYMSAGAILCFVYDKEDLSTSMYAHVTNNLVSYVATFLTSTNVLSKII
jgi:membrane protease YdiL (CAAX protease family)